MASRAPYRILSLALKSCSSAVIGEATAASRSSKSFPKISSQTRSISRSTRLPAELSCLESMMPLHSAIATARLRSILAAESQSWGMVPLGLSMPL